MTSNLELPRLLRLKQVLAPDGPIPVSKSTWWAGVRDGRFPKPLKLGPRTTVWRAIDIYALVDQTMLAQGGH
jgi:prophage regulatory protein